MSLPVPRFISLEGPYLLMFEMPGTPLADLIDDMNTEELDTITSQLKGFLAEMSKVTSSSLGSVMGRPFNNVYFENVEAPTHAFESIDELVEHYRRTLLFFCTEKFTEDLLSRIPQSGPIHFTHGDLLPRNILVTGTTITGIVDWATAGFYPKFWEYCIMANPEERLLHPKWPYVVESIFGEYNNLPGACALHQMLRAIVWNT